MMEVQLEKASRSNTIEREQIIRRLAIYPDETIDAVIHMLNSPKKKLWEIAVYVIRTIDYPRNARTIPILIAHVGDQNSPAWLEAVDALIDIGIDVVVPYLIFDLWDKNHHVYWGADVEGICSMLCGVDREYVVRCGPMITYILSHDMSPPDELDKGFLLQVLEKIGNDCANYAIPTLIGLIRAERNTDVGLQAKNLIASFEKEMLTPYKYILEQIDLLESDSASTLL